MVIRSSSRSSTPAEQLSATVAPFGIGDSPAAEDKGHVNNYTGKIAPDGSVSGTVVNEKKETFTWTADQKFDCTKPGEDPKPAEPQTGTQTDPQQGDTPVPVEPPPTDKVTMVITKGFPKTTVRITSTANIAGQCTYDATDSNGIGPDVNQTFDLSAKGSKTLTFDSPVFPMNYHVVVSCRGDFKGQNVEFGHVEQDVAG